MRRKKRIFYPGRNAISQKGGRRAALAHHKKREGGGDPGSYEAQQAIDIGAKERGREKVALYRRGEKHQTEGDIERAKRRAKIRHALIMKELE